AANLFTRNIYKEYIRARGTRDGEASSRKIVSLLVKVGALLFILLINPQFSLDLQLLGGAIILQTLPSVMLGLYTRWLHRGALLAGWAAGMIVSVWTFYVTPNAATKQAHWGGTGFGLFHLGLHTDVAIYIGFTAVVVNLAVAFGGTALLRPLKVAAGADQTPNAASYTAAADAKTREPTVTAGI